MNPLPYGAKLLPDHPLVGTRWASNNGHYPLRVVMAVCQCGEEEPFIRYRALLTNNVPGMKTWRLLDKHGAVSNHHRIGDADPHVERLSSMFEGIPGVSVSQVAEALRYPDYAPLPGPGDSNPKAMVPLYQDALIALGERLHEMQMIIEQQALATFESPAAGYAPGQPASQALDELEARVASLAAAVFEGSE